MLGLNTPASGRVSGPVCQRRRRCEFFHPPRTAEPAASKTDSLGQPCHSARRVGCGTLGTLSRSASFMAGAVSSLACMRCHDPAAPPKALSSRIAISGGRWMCPASQRWSRPCRACPLRPVTGRRAQIAVSVRDAGNPLLYRSAACCLSHVNAGVASRCGGDLLERDAVAVHFIERSFDKVVRLTWAGHPPAA